MKSTRKSQCCANNRCCVCNIDYQQEPFDYIYQNGNLKDKVFNQQTNAISGKDSFSPNTVTIKILEDEYEITKENDFENFSDSVTVHVTSGQTQNTTNTKNQSKETKKTSKKAKHSKDDRKDDRKDEEQISGTFTSDLTEYPNNNSDKFSESDDADIFDDFSEPDNCELLKCLILGEVITVTHDNHKFLHAVAKHFNLEDLSMKTKSFIYIKPSLASFLWHIFNSIFCFIAKLALFGKFFVSFWDITGPMCIISLFINILILFVTMSIITLRTNIVAFLLVVIPFILYSLFFPNIIIISIVEAFQCNIFRRKTLFYTQQRLFSVLMKVLFKKCTRRENLKFFNMKKWKDFFFGLVFLFFIINFMFIFVNNSAPDIFNIFLKVFIIFIPGIRYGLIYFLYLVHCFVSVSKVCRKRFRDSGDFDDPFLCSMYLRRLPWTTLITSTRKKDYDNEECRYHHRQKLSTTILRMIFSKTTFSVLIGIATIVYMILARNQTSAPQVAIVIVLFVLLILPLSSRITFPFFWIRRIRDVKMTEEQIKYLLRGRKKNLTSNNIGIRENLSTDDDKDDDDDEMSGNSLIREKNLVNFHISSVVWSKKYRILRWSSIIITTFTLFFVILMIPICLAIGNTYKVEKSSTSSSYSLLSSSSSFSFISSLIGSSLDDEINKYSQTSKHIEREKKSKDYSKDASTKVNYINSSEPTTFRETVSPACYMYPKGLSLIQVLALAQAAYSKQGKDLKYTNIMTEFFGKNYSDLVEFVETGFEDEVNKTDFECHMNHFHIKEPKLHVFSIRGTVSLQDLVADMELWFSSIMMNVFIPYIPLIQIFSEESIELMGLFVGLPRYTFRQFSVVEEYINRFNAYIESVEILPDEDVLITGHSLGGGIAKILTLMTGHESVALSGPGVRAVERFYLEKNKSEAADQNGRSKKRKNVRHSILDVVPGHDLIARIDLPLGTQISIPCKRGQACHDTYRSICQITALCGSFEEHREFCMTRFDNQTLDEMFEQGKPYSVF